MDAWVATCIKQCLRVQVIGEQPALPCSRTVCFDEQPLRSEVTSNISLINQDLSNCKSLLTLMFRMRSARTHTRARVYIYKWQGNQNYSRSLFMEAEKGRAKEGGTTSGTHQEIHSSDSYSPKIHMCLQDMQNIDP